LRSLPEFAAQRFVKAVAHLARQLDWLATAENLNSFFRLIDDQPALFAAGKMALEIPFQHPLEFAIDEIRKFVDDILAVQFAPPCWK
jgi:hypothetical protein